MRDPIILLVHLIATLARLMGPGGLRSVVAESVLVKQQLLILNRSRHRAPNLCLWVANYYSARNPLRLSSLVILGVVARMFRCATRSSCWCT